MVFSRANINFASEDAPTEMKNSSISSAALKIADLNISQVNLVSLQSYQIVQNYTGCISINMESVRNRRIQIIYGTTLNPHI